MVDGDKTKGAADEVAEAPIPGTHPIVNVQVGYDGAPKEPHYYFELHYRFKLNYRVDEATAKGRYEELAQLLQSGAPNRWERILANLLQYADIQGTTDPYEAQVLHLLKGALENAP